MQEVFIITGNKESGKTAVVRQLADRFGENGVSVDGLYSEAGFEHGIKTGYFTRYIRSCETYQLASTRTDAEGNIQFGYDFKPEAIAAGLNYLNKSIASDPEILILDEIGREELDGGGWSLIFPQIFASGIRKLVITVRPSLLEAVIKKWDFPDPAVYDARLGSSLIGSLIEGEIALPRRNEVTGIILAGGKSSRMGRDKALVVYKGRPLLEHMYHLLLPFCARILISSDNPQHGIGHELVPDEIADAGPKSGLYSALKRSETQKNLVVACDSPFLHPAVLATLLQHAAEALAVVPSDEAGNIQPLSAVYNSTVAEVLKRQLAAGNRAMRGIFDEISTRVVQPAKLLLPFNPQWFTNLNREEDLDQNR